MDVVMHAKRIGSKFRHFFVIESVSSFVYLLVSRLTLIRCSGRPRARDSEGGGGIKEGLFRKKGFALQGFTAQ